MRLTEATDWVLSQAITQCVDLKTDGYSWTMFVDAAVDMFDVDVEMLDSALCAALMLTEPPASPFSSGGFNAVGLEVITDPVEVARYRAMCGTST